MSFVGDVQAILEEPCMYEQAVALEQRIDQEHTMAEEYNSLLKNNAWTFCAPPTGRKSIKSKLVYRIKLKSSMVMWIASKQEQMQKATPKHMVLTMSKHLLTPVVNKNIYGMKQVSGAWNTKFVTKYELQATTA